MIETLKGEMIETSRSNINTYVRTSSSLRERHAVRTYGSDRNTENLWTHCCHARFRGHETSVIHSHTIQEKNHSTRCEKIVTRCVERAGFIYGKICHHTLRSFRIVSSEFQIRHLVKIQLIHLRPHGFAVQFRDYIFHTSTRMFVMRDSSLVCVE